jgi:hypothetical protein
MRSVDPALADFEKASGSIRSSGRSTSTGRRPDQQCAASPKRAEIDRGIALGVHEPERPTTTARVAKEGLDDMKGAYFDYRKAIELDPAWTLPQNQMAAVHGDHPALSCAGAGATALCCANGRR